MIKKTINLPIVIKYKDKKALSALMKKLKKFTYDYQACDWSFHIEGKKHKGSPR